MTDDNSWDEWKNLILSELKDLKENDKCIIEKISKIRVDIGKLQVKSGFLGAIAGFGAGLIIIIIEYFKRR